MEKLNIYSLKVGSIVSLKASTVKKYGFHQYFIKEGNRPFVVGKVTDYGAFWLVPSYSRCTDYNQNTKKYYKTISTPNGDTKFLKFRDMIVVEFEDLIGYSTSDNTIKFTDIDLIEFKNKFKNNIKLLKKNREYFELKFKKPFIYEKNIITQKYLKMPYNWLERDFNIVKSEKMFNAIDEFDKSDFAAALYNNYVLNLKNFILERNKYIPTREDTLISYFGKNKLSKKYKYYTENGYVLALNPIKFTADGTEGMFFDSRETGELNIYYEPEEFNVKEPAIDNSNINSVLRELIYLDNHIVSQKTYYEVYKKTPSKTELKIKLKSIKDYIKKEP